MGFGEKLRAARESKGFTQQQVADKMGIDKSTYCGYETGKRQPDVPKLKQLSKILGVSGDDLLETEFSSVERAPTISGERSGRHDVLDDVDIAFYGEFKELDEDQKQAVRNMVSVMRGRRSKKQGQ